MISIELPFPGLYQSTIAGELEHIEEQEAEWAEERQAEDNIPKELRLDASKFSQILYNVTDYGAAHLAIAKAYCEQFEDTASEILGFKLGLTFEEMTSPKEYNFTTDWLFAQIPEAVVSHLFAVSQKNKHRVLDAMIRRNHTSRSGFISFYSSNLECWLEKGLDDWDYIELGTLLQAVLKLRETPGDDEITRHVSEAMIYAGELFYNIHSNAVDWQKYETEVAEARQELADAELEANPEWVPPYRCDETADLFRA